ncbi:hypothetical protein [Undibacterium oligocarboniphilum]|uniref:Uncharacterized protein n=1 Tax=Undibacterium oligocarboniphilum TaxID=666702 RepID=A0A850QM79_9BURK|nr:hypothetical protein [Undibacterium oligocarboniphilum]MBC3869451.1 hypothetical protein [Undibacterium oligocarboniphilum]NVO77830.1 hypothetical protein [Undibacterium oligocarboniphilum]
MHHQRRDLGVTITGDQPDSVYLAQPGDFPLLLGDKYRIVRPGQQRLQARRDVRLRCRYRYGTL